MPKLPRLTFQNQHSARHGAGELLGHDTPEWRHMLPQPEITFEDLFFLFMAGFNYGACSADLAKFKPSLQRTSLRRQRRQSQHRQIRKQLTFTIQKLQKQKIGTWKSLRTVQFIVSPHHWRFLRDLTRKSFGRTIVEHPSANEFATYLSEIFFWQHCKNQQSTRFDRT